MAAISVGTAQAQRVQFPTPTETTLAQDASAVPSWTNPALPPSTVAPPDGYGGATLSQGIQPFDPYASTSPPSPLGPINTQPPMWPAPPGTTPSLPAPYYPYGATATPPPALPMQPPSSIYPQGYPQAVPPGTATGPPYERLFQNTGFSYTWLYGNEENELQMNDVDISTTMVLQCFAHSDQGLRLTPGFTFHFLDGPQPPIPTDTNLPAQLYDAYLDAQWNPNLTQQFTAELNVRTGVYSDFNTVTSDSVRLMGTAMGALQCTPRLTVKLGATYLDRLEVKVLPAGGVVWEPHPQVIYELIFPWPRISHYWKAVGNADLWWYVGGEYGAGSWTIERLNAPLLGMTDRIDINDIRIFGGFQWRGLYNRVGFFEVGYVFDREIVFDLVPQDNLDLKDTIMLGGGFRF